MDIGAEGKGGVGQMEWSASLLDAWPPLLCL